MGNRQNKFNIRRNNYNDENTFTNAMKTKIPSFNIKYANKLEIKEDKLQYIGEDEQERAWLAQAISVAGILKISYVFENGAEAAPTYEQVIPDGSYEVESPTISGYEPDHYMISGEIQGDTNITVTYYPPSQGLEYELLSDGTYTVAGIGNFTGENLVIPREYDGKAVTQIKEDAFYGNSTIKELVITNVIKDIGATAFARCAKLEKLNLNAEKSNNARAFEGCSNLKNVIIGKNIKNIAGKDFQNCTNLIDLEIYTEQADINSWQFASCTALKKVNVSETNSKYIVKDGVLYSKDEKKIYMYPPGKEGETFLIPDKVEEIRRESFWNNLNLTQIYISNKIKNVGLYAFEYCYNLQYVDINAEKIEKQAFNKCNSLKNIKIGENVKDISGRAFDSCINLTDVEIHTEQADIDAWQFASCTALKKVNISETNNKYIVKDGVLYSKDEKIIYMYPPGKEGETFLIPDKVEEIRRESFWQNLNLKNINITSAVNKIGEYVFENCKNIVSFNYLGTMQEWNNISKAGSWKDNSSLTQVICSDGTINL